MRPESRPSTDIQIVFNFWGSRIRLEDNNFHDGMLPDIEGSDLLENDCLAAKCADDIHGSLTPLPMQIAEAQN